MCVTSLSSKAGADMSAMRLAQGMVSLIDPNPNVLDGHSASENNKALLEGEGSRAELREASLPPGGTGG